MSTEPNPMPTTPQPDAAKMTPTPERFERDHWLPLYVDDCKNYTHNEETISEGYHHIDGGRGFYDEARPQSGICFSGVMSKEQADYIATACNSHARLLAENAALVKALEKDNAALKRELEGVMATMKHRTDGHTVVYSERLKPHIKSIEIAIQSAQQGKEMKTSTKD